MKYAVLTAAMLTMQVACFDLPKLPDVPNPAKIMDDLSTKFNNFKISDGKETYVDFSKIP